MLVAVKVKDGDRVENLQSLLDLKIVTDCSDGNNEAGCTASPPIGVPIYHVVATVPRNGKEVPLILATYDTLTVAQTALYDYLLPDLVKLQSPNHSGQHVSELPLYITMYGDR